MNLGAAGVIVASRLQSSRLPGKALLPLQGMPMLLFLLRRLRSVRRATVALATTELPSDDALASLAEHEGVLVFRGSENDVVGRYVGAAARFGFDTVVRVTADCPFVDADLVEFGLAEAARFESCDLATTKGRFPVGLDIEIYAAAAMASVHATRPLSAAHREHLTSYFYDHSDEFVIRAIDPPREWPTTRQHFTVDTQADYNIASGIAGLFDRPDFSVPAMLAKTTT